MWGLLLRGVKKGEEGRKGGLLIRGRMEEGQEGKTGGERGRKGRGKGIPPKSRRVQ